MNAPIVEIDGAAFRDLDGFYREFARVTSLGAVVIRNCDSFDDILSGGFGGVTNSSFTLRWKNAETSKKRLGQDAFWQLVNIIQSHGRGGKRARPQDRLITLVLT